ncbi:40S ribosomal protein mrp4 [Taphrina deformans PYCC 5710]|uniref:40S ribosomal protein mrp4 n=1 Tax=Taphrina deformans (strain PYCC 5710 / ATCC 11124 / CBS 356.35 / IMI 108563 / JCM 9778 / NBRC 8474) TaxID=1097556 RepID=R4X6F3_TAPDE|nr:40S ribosomal protein mrp4 [Taphrina deformans PYCC 5710]|eukprot:CCG80669.1 40S ribosomal protein mrp4 [Taphrina deformans PYCC 5710]
MANGRIWLRPLHSYGHCCRKPGYTALQHTRTIVTITEDQPASTDLDDILDSFDSVSSERDIEQFRTHTDLKEFVEQSSTPRTGSSSSLSEIELRRRRDRTTTKLENIGSEIKQTYAPRQNLNDPPEISAVGIPALVASQAHLGHSTALWNPLTQPFIYGIRNGIHILNLDLTLSHLRRAAEVVKGVAQNDGNILFVGTRPGQKRSVVEAAKRANGYHVFERWVPGTITNGKQVVGHGNVKSLVTKHRQNRSPTSNPHLPPNSVIPDLVIVLNPLENRNLLKECAKGRVPTIGIIDTDVDPRLVTYSIPANDDSIRCTSLLVGVLSRAAALGRAQMVVPDWEQIESV